VAANGQNVGEYFYDGEGKRVKKKVYEADGLTVKEETVFVYSSGKLVAEYSTKPAPENPMTSYTATDQLLSPRVITNSLGEVVSRRDFMPFGEEAISNIGERPATLKYGAIDSVRQKFTGYQKDDETELDFAEARMYENRHGRFTAVDPLLASGKSANPQSFNRYVYVMNNPIVFTDPTGLQTNSNPNGNRNFIPPSTAGTRPCDFTNPKCTVWRDREPLAEVMVSARGDDEERASNYPVRAMLMGFPANPWEQAAEGFWTGTKNIPIAFSNTVTTLGTIGFSTVSGNATVDYDSLSINFGTNPLYIKPFGCSTQIGCSWSTGTTAAGLSAPGIVGGVFRGGASSLSEIAIQNSSPNYVYRGVTPSQIDSIASGDGIVAKNPRGTWSLEKHIVDGSSRTKRPDLNDPWISTSDEIGIAKSFSPNVIRIDTNKIPFMTPMNRGYDIFNRTNKAYHLSVWQRELSIFQRVPSRAITVVK
jgi:RHS repeat-associated protein